MLRKYFAFVLPLLGLATACKNTGGRNFHVSLTYTNADKLEQAQPAFPGNGASWVYLAQIPYGKNQAMTYVDSAKLNGSTGKVELKGKKGGEGIYELIFGENALGVPFINDESDIRITADLAGKKDFYSVSGSAASRQLQDLLKAVGGKNQEVEASFAALDSLSRINAPDSLLKPATEAKDAAISGLNDYLKKFISSTQSGTLGFLALSWASRSFSPQDMDESMKDLNKRFPGNAYLSELQKDMARQQQAQPSGNSWVGKTVPELTLPDVNGNPVSISSFKGKYLLIDFWASWCGPCRMENPNVVAAYKKFKGKNFAILGVSLDKDKESWKKAIADDHLTWTHISDLKYWSSEAVQIFGFEGIPFNVLVDPSGKVIAQELRGGELESKLAQVLN
ncbi:MAG TPA: TlpA disulfide reductase family protein [Puia sp.]|nr:TlpA disulfide reductase family protein [Puia sp.]